MVDGVTLGEEETFKVGLFIFFADEGGDFFEARVLKMIRENNRRDFRF